MAKVARAKKGMVVAAHPIAADAGREILAEGGTAVEAAIAACLTLSVVEPFASGLGGGGCMLVHKAGRTEVLDFRGVTSSLATEETIYPRGATLPWQPKVGPSSATVPGQGRGLDMAMRRYGRGIPMARLCKKAIETAQNGFDVSETFVYVSGLFEGTLRSFPDAAKLYLNNGRRRRAGERLKQPELARTLRLIADKGFEVLYTGELAKAITKVVNATGPVWGDTDLETYRAKPRVALTATIGEHEIATMPPPSRGGAGIIQSLLRWQADELVRYGHNSPTAIAIMAETFREVFAELEPLIGDPDIFPVDLGQLVSHGLKPSTEAPTSGSPSTTHVTVVDSERTVVTLSTTIGHFWGSGLLVPEWGILLNDDISDMERGPGRRNSVGPSRRCVSNMAPTIVLRGGRPLFALGTPGSLRIFPCLAQVISNVVLHGMGLEAAVAAGRVHWEDSTLWLEGDIPADARAGVKQKWHDRIVERRAQDLFFGGVHAAAIEPDGSILGVADPRRDGVASGV